MQLSERSGPMQECRLEFPKTDYRPVVLREGLRLADELTAVNSPCLFGCRSGLCGTCLVEVEVLEGRLEGPDPHEKEALEVYAPGNEKARLACQLKLTASLSIMKIESL